MDQIAQACHQIRQQWRKQQFLRCLNGPRHEAIAVLHAFSEDTLRQHFDHINWKAARETLLTCSAAQRSVMLGATVSPAWRARGNRNGTALEESCPWCDHAPGHWGHIAEQCSGRLRGHPGRLENPFQRRMGWLVLRQPRSYECFIYLGWAPTSWMEILLRDDLSSQLPQGNYMAYGSITCHATLRIFIWISSYAA